MFQKYALISAAVVDESGRLVGQMTVDDVVHIISEEAGEDALLMSGAGEWPTSTNRFARLFSSRGTLADRQSRHRGGRVLDHRTVRGCDRGIGGAGNSHADCRQHRRQCRDADHGGGGARDCHQPTHPARNTRRILWREFRVALLNGSTIALLIGLAAGLLFSPMMGVVIAVAMVVNIAIAGLAGVLVPVIFERLDQDPAVASSVFVTMITDSMGFLAFLGLAVAVGLAPL